MGYIIIKGMNMPKNCWYCPLAIDNSYCSINPKIKISFINEFNRDKRCPMLEIEKNINDLISRHMAIDVLEDGIDDCEHIDPYLDGMNDGLKIALDAIKHLPVVEPETEQGEWTEEAHCPFCDFAPWYEGNIHTLSYCPNCGADLRGEVEDEK